MHPRLKGSIVGAAVVVVPCELGMALDRRTENPARPHHSFWYQCRDDTSLVPTLAALNVACSQPKKSGAVLAMTVSTVFLALTGYAFDSGPPLSLTEKLRDLKPKSLADAAETTGYVLCTSLVGLGVWGVNRVITTRIL